MSTCFWQRNGSEIEIFHSEQEERMGGRTRGARAIPTFGNNLKDECFNNRTIEVCVRCSWRGPKVPSTPHLTVSLFFCSSKATYMCWGWGPFKCAVSAQKAVLGSETEGREMLGGRDEKSLSLRRVVDLSSHQLHFTRLAPWFLIPNPFFGLRRGWLGVGSTFQMMYHLALIAI